VEVPEAPPPPPRINPGAGGSAFDPALPLGVDGRIAFNYSALWEPTRSVESGPGELGMVRQETGLRFPIWKNGADALFGGVSVRSLLFNTDVILPDTGQAFPNRLWDVRGNLQYKREFSNGWTGGLGGSLGSTGDRPFAGWKEVLGGANASLRIPVRERDAWLFSLSYQPTGGLPFPIPGLAYVWQPNDQLTANIGIPFQLYWRPIEKLRFDASYLPVQRVRAYATWELTETVELFGGFDWINESYLLWDRRNDDDFFNLLEKRLPLGVRWYVTDSWIFDASAGYVFDRVFFSGPDILDQSSNRVAVAPGAFAMLRLLYRF
jgi:hypothetical protein